MRKPVLLLLLLAVLLPGVCTRAAEATVPARVIADTGPAGGAELFTPEEKAWLEAHRGREFLVGVAQDYVPIEYIDADGQARGMGMELLKKAGQLTGLTFTLYPRSRYETWEEILQSTREKRVDVLSTVSLTEDRAAYLEFSAPYIEITQVLLGHKDTTQWVKDFSQIQEAVFAVPRGYWFLDMILQEIPGAKILNVSNMEAALQAVSDKKADYTICEIPVFTYYKEQRLYKDIQIVGELKEKNRIFIGARQDLQELIPIINKVIDHINYAELYEKSMVIPRDSRAERRLVALTFLLGLLSLVLVYFLRRTFQKLVKAKQEAQQANLDKSRLMTNISHDLRTPLTVIKGYAQALADGEAREADREKYIRRVCAKVDDVSAMVDDLFLLSRLEDNRLTLQTEAVGLTDFLKQLTADTALKAKARGVAVSFLTGSAGDIVKEIDRVKFGRAVENLLENAVNYSVRDGRVTLSLRTAADGKAEITVQDNGPGIAAEDLPHIFDRYYQGKDASNESNGLGLYIAREIVRRHGGEIAASSDGRRNSTFIIRL